MFSRKHRIRKKKEIVEIFKIGKKLNSKTIVIKYRKNDLNYGRFAIIVGKKTEKFAYKRNNLKRKIRHVLYEKSIKKSFDVLCYLYGSDVLVLKKDLLYLLPKIK